MIYQDDQVTVSYDKTVPCIVWTPEGFLKGDQFRIPFEKGMNFMEEQIKKEPNLSWLNDARRLKTFGVEDVEWLNKNINDRAQKIGVKRVAFILPENVFGKWAIKLYADYTKRRSEISIDIRAFKNRDDAVKWLKSTVNSNIEDISFI